ncbi:MAG: PEP-CTERM sorting domain-containing protein [Halioglobus sp.]|nr:PEP-CTERM sorting domain-containing protein [Halioglobus sp.]MCB1736439.1 PEP-CTERM sorting domain-containing protein [Gammaproteobacteria bacterium]MCP5137415.1 PEP-CTERM sorting domain-containing protein [Gammaproteobacteria bacterium]
MLNKNIFISLLSVLSLALPGLANALIYQVNTGSGWQNLTTLNSAQTAAQHYGPLNIGPGYAESDTAFMWLHTNTNTGDVAWGMLLDVNSDVTSGNANITLQGMPTSSYISLRDDGYEPGNIVSGTFNAVWAWIGCCTDGVVVDGMNGEWQVDVELTSYSGINNWYFLTGDVNAPDRIALSDDFSVRAVDGNSIPVPAPLALFALGGVSVMLRRRAMFA